MAEEHFDPETNPYSGMSSSEAARIRKELGSKPGMEEIGDLFDEWNAEVRSIVINGLVDRTDVAGALSTH